MTPTTDRAWEPASAMRLSVLSRALGAIEVIGRATRDDVVLRGIRQDSRDILPGELFAIRSGAQTNGWRHLADAVGRGAAAVMAEAHEAVPELPVPFIVVHDVREAIGRAAALLYGDPTRSLSVVGITGTNGKTTTSYLVKAALERASFRPGLMGTVGYQFEELLLPAPHTTPESDEIARTASAMAQRGASHLVMEVSSHALAQGRLSGVHFAVAAFTNLTQDHLDFHGDMRAYGEAKARLFLELAPEGAVINIDDPFGRELAERVACPVVTVTSSEGGNADLFLLRIELGARRTSAALRTPVGEVRVDSNLIGAHNLSNIMVALGVAHALGIDLELAASAMSEAAVPGRLERCDGPQDDLVVVVDYAHTPDALDRVLSALTSLRKAQDAPSNLTCIFGCGGDRDRSKREPMGRAVAKWADLAVVTTDNPRSEDPRAIVDDILPGLAGARAVVIELDRARAIHDAIMGARSGDVVLIAGKGHETYQIVGPVSRDFDDRAHARSALTERRSRPERAS